MTGVTISEDDGRFRVSGPLTFATVDRRLMETSRQRFEAAAGDGEVVVDLADVQAGDSAGLALLIEWVRWCTLAGTRLRIENPPASLLGIAAISDVTGLLGFDGGGGASGPAD